MWFSTRPNKRNNPKSTGVNRPVIAPEELQTGQNQYSGYMENEIPDSLLDWVRGGINPQPLPPQKIDSD